MGEQSENLNRVKSNIASYVVMFVTERIGYAFYASELREYVQARHGVAPTSPDRVLRDLRQRGVINYQVVSRSESLYQALPLAQPAQTC